MVVIGHVPEGNEGVERPVRPRHHVLPGHDGAHRPPVLVVRQVVLQQRVREQSVGGGEGEGRSRRKGAKMVSSSPVEVGVLAGHELALFQGVLHGRGTFQALELDKVLYTEKLFFFSCPDSVLFGPSTHAICASSPSTYHRLLPLSDLVLGEVEYC